MTSMGYEKGCFQITKGGSAMPSEKVPAVLNTNKRLPTHQTTSYSKG